LLIPLMSFSPIEGSKGSKGSKVCFVEDGDVEPCAKWGGCWLRKRTIVVSARELFIGFVWRVTL
jgi:hypothetical protein